MREGEPNEKKNGDGNPNNLSTLSDTFKVFYLISFHFIWLEQTIKSGVA